MLQLADKQTKPVLREEHRHAVLERIRRLSTADLDRLDAALIPTLERDRLRPQGIELWRMVRFIRHPPPLPRPEGFTTSGGTKVTFKTGTLDTGGGVSATLHELSSLTGKREGYSLTYFGSDDALDCRWLQMIWRDAVLVYPASVRQKARNVAVHRRWDHLASLDLPYFLTTHPDRANKPEVCCWHADAAQAKSPFYDTIIHRSGSILNMFDAPSPTIDSVGAKAYFADANPPTSIVSGFHAETFLVRGMDVLYRVRVEIVWKQMKGSEDPKPKITLLGDPAYEIRAEHRARLAIQAPEFNWLPGPPVSEPLPEAGFERVRDLTNSSWASVVPLAQRIVDVALQADTGQLQFLRSRYLATEVNAKTPFKAGLNIGTLVATVPGSAETGYVDANGKYVAANIPIERDGMLPRVAIIMNAASFFDGKIPYTRDWPVTALRHEMRHAAQDAYTIGWLTRWRDAFTSAQFRRWFDQQIPKSEKDLRWLILIANTGGSPSPTEVLAYTEGFITGVLFLPLQVDPALLVKLESWPAALRELAGGVDYLNRLRTEIANTVQPLALARIRAFVCGTATPAEKDVLAKWMAAVIDPQKITPPASVSAISLVNGMFRGQPQLIKSIADIASKPCPH